jgi:hypothetical protein
MTATKNDLLLTGKIACKECARAAPCSCACGRCSTIIAAKIRILDKAQRASSFKYHSYLKSLVKIVSLLYLDALVVLKAISFDRFNVPDVAGATVTVTNKLKENG